MNRDSFTALIILLVIAVGSGGVISGYYYGKHQGFASGYSIGKEKAPKPNYYAEQQYPIVQGELADLTVKYNSLVNDYNNLRSAVIRYIGATSYQARSPITCNTSTYGINNQFATTNCY